ncbi:MAG: protein kinase [Leptolyngbyaceae cyanobacterium SL_7_1]|nr:protein kinase [Leptolyngbyaceae cyanobacterium SL_7_1]
MICCLNPRCRNPQNPDGAALCQSCGDPLMPLLRGRYRAVQPIGQGGFGRTYLASDEDRLGMRCVIKQFSPQVQGTKSLEKAVSLFNQEAVRLHELGEHPQIPSLLAYFEQDGYLYLVQQFIEGQNLLQEMRQQGAFNERQVREVLSDILPVLRFVHNHHVIHRDITPMNILRRQGDDRLMLIDFGIAKQLTEAASGEPGTRIGTEGYAPMEQFRGGRAFPASDLYSLGSTCLHLMTETKPDHLYDPLEGRWVWREHLQEKGVLVSDQFAHILDMMLKDLVGERYQSADEVMRDLNADYFIPSETRRSPPGRRVFGASMPSPQPSPAPKLSTAQAAGSLGRSPQPSHPPRIAVNQPLFKPPSSNQPLSKPPLSKPPQAADGRCFHTLVGHTSWVTTVAIAPDGVTFASGGLDDTIKLWTVRGELLVTLSAHRRGVNTLAISPNGQLLVSGGDDYLIKTWSMQSGALLGRLTGHSRDVNAIVISPNGQILASGAEDRTIRLWHMGTGNVIRTLLGMGSMIKSLTISADGNTLISGGFDNAIKLWSLQTGQAFQTLTGHMAAINALAVSPDNQVLASASRDKTVKIWDLTAGRLICTLADHSRDVNSIAFTPDNKTLISASSDTTIKLWNLDTAEVKETLTGHHDSVNAIALSNDGDFLVSGSSDKTVKVWRL